MDYIVKPVKIENKRKFVIGEWVQVRGIYKFDYRGDHESYVRCYTIKDIDTFDGIVVGISRHLLGKKELIGWDEGYSFTTTGYVEAWKVIRGLVNKPISVPDSHIMGCIDPNIKLPIQHSCQPKWTKKKRDYLRQEMEYFPRDKKGRWMRKIRFSLIVPQ